MPAAPAPAPAQSKNAPVLAPWPFPVGVLGTENASDYQEVKQQTTGTVKFPDVKVEPDGWLRGLWFDFNMVVTTNTNTVSVTEDTPFNVIDTVLFRDTGGEQVFGPFGGYDWMLTNKFGAYHAQGDPRSDPNYSTVAGDHSAADGSFHFVLYLPLEISAADSLGDVENRSENSIYRVELTMAASTTVYTQVPGTLGFLTIKTSQDSYTEPVAAMALSGRPVSSAPPSPGTLQYWKQEDVNLNAAAQSALITNGIGNGYRNIIFINRETGETADPRVDGGEDFPDPLEVTLGTTRTRNLYKKLWQAKMARAFELRGTVNLTNGLESGVFVLWFTQDVGIKPGDEARRRYQRTKTGNTYKIRGTWTTAACTLFINTNYVVPRGNDFSQVVA
jgi:hypothetical protein